MKNRIVTRITREYKVEHPFASAAMAFVGTAPDLAIAVCNAGGIGSIAAGPLPAETIRGLIKEVKNATEKPLNVNFITFLAREEQINVCIEEKVPIVSFHWDHPPYAFIERLHDAGIKVWEQVGSVEAAVQAVEDDVDVIVAQGSEAGGHNYGTLPTFIIVPTIVEAVRPTPVLAAGGIVTGRQLAAALVLGAEGAWVGTRLVASQEAYAHPLYKDKLTKTDSTQTRLTSIYGPNIPHFNPMRVLDVGLTHEFAGRENSAPKDLELQPRIGTMKLAGEEISLHRFTNFVPTPDTEGDIEQLPFLSGQGVGLIHEVLSVKEIIESMISDAVLVLSMFQMEVRKVESSEEKK